MQAHKPVGEGVRRASSARLFIIPGFGVAVEGYQLP
ncbi:hypothetical protein PS938_03857 [Pseudomonas fluorescens]|uniref:Uncharacterized protein n=1 Tax=Pseudomonas fluorescens TaxID=294 RepID=A0A5E7UPK7_PSEFL|nr:hypothetical protein PS938_03857 [Pseudomonas fluorescens]